jgi:hypothetical protein
MRKLLLLLATMALPGCPGCTVIIGTPCSEQAPCAEPYACDTTMPGGYCTRACTTEGDSARECAFSGDQYDGVCARFDGGLTCLRVCSAPGDCREGYRCVPAGDGGVGGCMP